MQQRKYRHILSVTLVLMFMTLSVRLNIRTTAAHSPARPLTQGCDPDAEELADFQDNNCNGFGDEPPIGFTREDYSMQGYASAVEWYGDYCPGYSSQPAEFGR